MKIKLKLRILIGLFMLGGLFPLRAQILTSDSLSRKVEDIENWFLYRNHDTSYIKSYAEKVAIKLILINKYNYFRIRDLSNDIKLHYRPVRDLSFGFGVSYKWFSIELTTTLGLRNNAGFSDPKAFDFQGRIFSSRQYISATLQYYYGYKLTDYSGFDEPIPESSKEREDIRTITFGLQYLYALNYDNFSLKAPFVYNEVQRRSAGSFIGGAGFSLYSMDADSSVIPETQSDQFSSDLALKDLNVISVSASFGYMYSFVYKEKFFLTLGLIPGLVLNFGDYLTESREPFNPNASFRINTMNSIGYNNNNFYGGFQLIGDIFDVRIEKKLRTTIGYGRMGFFVGYRF